MLAAAFFGSYCYVTNYYFLLQLVLDIITTWHLLVLSAMFAICLIDHLTRLDAKTGAASEKFNS